MIAIDSHTHLHFKIYDSDRDEVIRRAKNSGIKAIVNVSISPKDFDIMMEKLSKYYEEGYMFPTLGFAPQLIESIDIEEFRKYALSDDRFIAIGECGLDYYWVTNPNLIQKMENAFIEILEITKKLKKPLIIHARTAHKKNAYIKILDWLKQYNIKRAVFHAFLGSKKDMEQILNNGWFIGIPTVYIRRKDLWYMLEEIPIENILVETDSPYLAPQKGKRNEPANVIMLIDYIAKIKRLDRRVVAEIIFKTTVNFFDLPL